MYLDLRIFVLENSNTEIIIIIYFYKKCIQCRQHLLPWLYQFKTFCSDFKTCGNPILYHRCLKDSVSDYGVDSLFYVHGGCDITVRKGGEVTSLECYLILEAVTEH